MQTQVHQYIDRKTGKVMTERFFGDSLVRMIFNEKREHPGLLTNAVTSSRMSAFLGFVNFESLLLQKFNPAKRFAGKAGIDMGECADPPESLNTPKKFFERKIRYWETRPMPENPGAVVSPADSRMLVGSFCETEKVYVKNKFFAYDALLGKDKTQWLSAFSKGDFAVFRLTPDKYHYNHTPVAGRVLDFYEIPGRYYPCNPSVIQAAPHPLSRNRRVVTILDTDTKGGTKVGLVAMVEVAALMIGGIRQAYSENQYDHPQQIRPGMFLQKGCPKSLYTPGSSTDVLLFQKNRVCFSFDIVKNMFTPGVVTRFGQNGFGRPVVETEVSVRSQIGLGK